MKATQNPLVIPMKSLSKFLLPVVLLAGSAQAFAHAGAGDAAGGFIAGFLHPVLGWDHVVHNQKLKKKYISD